MSHVPLSAGPTMPFSPDALGTFIPGDDAAGRPPEVIKHPTIMFDLRIPTWEDRDMMSLRMYALGVREVGADQIRALMISELYTVFPDENEADDNARFLEGFWQRQQAYAQAVLEYDEQEAIRRGDELEAGRPFEAAPRPEETTTPRERARAALLTADLTDGSVRLRNKLTDQQLYQRRLGTTIAQLTIAGWRGLKAEAAFEARPSLDAPVLTKATIEQIRGELMELDQTGAAWDELTAECERMYDLPRSEEKNSSSPAGNISEQAGSTTKSTESVTSDGSSPSSEPTEPSPASSSEQTPDGTSPPTTETLSVCSLVSDTVTSRHGQTDEKSSSSLSD